MTSNGVYKTSIKTVYINIAAAFPQKSILVFECN